MSTTLADQLKIKKTALSTPLSLQLAVQGSRSKINLTAVARLQYQDIDSPRHFDIINLNSYDIILGTPWLFQHSVCVGFRPARIIIGQDNPQPIQKGQDTKLMVNSVNIEDSDIISARKDLQRMAEPLCKNVEDTDLPPLRVVNHTILLIDLTKIYPWRPSKCLEVFRKQWAEKRDAYLKTGRWKITSAGDTVPILLIPKPRTTPPQLRTVVNLRERNKDTRKLTSPLPDMEGMLRKAASKPFRSAPDLKSAYERIQIVPEHVDRTTATPDRNMVSLVIQIGDCNLFDFGIVHVPGIENLLADALSRIYSYNSPGTIRASSECAYVDVVDDDTAVLRELPVLAGLEARVMSLRHSRRPESFREFAKRMADRFVRRGPSERKEGGSTAEFTSPTLHHHSEPEIGLEPMSTPTNTNGLELYAPGELDEQLEETAEPAVGGHVPKALPSHNIDEQSISDQKALPSLTNGRSPVGNKEHPSFVDLVTRDDIDFINNIRNKYNGDSVFEIKWKAGDITWLSHHQVSHLQALKYYLDVYGVDEVGQLPPGKGNPPPQDHEFSGNFIELNLLFILPTENLFKPDDSTVFPPSSFPSTSYLTPCDPYHKPYLNDLDMGKKPAPHSIINHPKFQRQSRYLILITNDSVPYQYIHVSQIHEAIKSSDALLTQDTKNVSRCIAPMGYTLIATTWNTYTTNRKYFAMIQAARSSDEQPSVYIGGIPVSIHDFHITLEDCGLGILSQPDHELSRLSRHIAMTAVYDREQRDLRQQQRYDRRATGYSTRPNHSVTTGRKRRRGDDEHPHHSNSQPDYFDDLASNNSQNNLDFSQLNQLTQSHFFHPDEDATMSNPGPSDVTDETAPLDHHQLTDNLHDVDALLESPMLESRDTVTTGTTTQGIDLSLLKDATAEEEI
jgi:hypothetical protein